MFTKPISPVRRRVRSGMTLIEMLIALSIGLVLLGLISAFLVFGFRSFNSLANYAILEYASRKALDQITYTVRQAHSANMCTPTAVQVQMVHDDGSLGNVRFEYDADSQTLNMVDEDGNMTQLLSDCDRLNFAYFQRPAPTDSWNNLQNLGTNSPGLCKVVQVSWKCSRQLVGSLENTELMQSTKIVLRCSNWKSNELNN